MKIYKTSEIVKMLEVNPTLRFLSLKYKVNYVEVVDGVVCWDGDREQPLHIVINETASTWKLMSKPVTFDEAIKSNHYDRKTIRCEIDGETYTYPPANNLYQLCSLESGGLSAKEIVEGKWFIEEE